VDPGPERRAAAAALFSHDPNASENSWGILIAASRYAGDILTERELNSYDRDARLSERFGRRAKEGHEQIIQEAVLCVAEPMAWSLYVPDLVSLKQYASSPEGRNFWSFFVSKQPWYDCFRRPVRDYLAPYVEDDLAAVVAETPIR